MIRQAVIIVSLVLTAAASDAQHQNKILVASASDLKFALDSMVEVFRERNRGTVDVTYGSSGKLYEQISNGAPFDLFFSADISYPEQLKKNGLTVSDVYPYGVGRIVIWSKKIDTQSDGIKSLLHPSIKKIAIANPAHAPYGKRAVESLVHYKIHETIAGKLVYGENISQAAQFVTSGAADMGIVALSLALSPNMKKEKGNFFLIPEKSHDPLLQGVVLTRHAKGNDLALNFLNFVKGDTANAILHHYGFTRP